MKFESLSLCKPLLQNLQAEGYLQPTPIQQKAIPRVLEGRDLVGCAQTGTGKTAAFALPTLQHLLSSKTAPTGADRRRQRSGRRAIQALILAPTRELAVQIGDSLATYGKSTGLRHAVIYGGVRQGPQVRALQAGINILVATPGRLLDLIGQGFVKLDAVEILILDEADQMLDMGFIHDLRKIVAHVPGRRQTLMFSATMPREIRDLADQWLRRPFEVRVAPVASTPELVSQAVYFVERCDKAAALAQFIQSVGYSKTLVFSRTKRGADKIARYLQRDGIRAVAIHGDKSQATRQAVIREFNSERPPILVATDLASRGLDFSDVVQVINYDMPDAPEAYVHRIGRTARAGATGRAVSFCGQDERRRLRMIEKLIGKSVCVEQLPEMANVGEANIPKAKTGRPDAAQPEQQERSPRRTRRSPRPARGGKSSVSIGAKRRRFSKASRGRRKGRSSTADCR